MNTEKAVIKLYERNMLNEKGLRQYIKYLRNEIKDFRTKRTELITENPKDIERLNKRRTRIALK